MSETSTLEPPPSGASGADLDTELAEVAGILNATHGRLVGLVREALDEGEWQQAGILSPAQWLAWKTGLSPHRAAEIVAAAERSRELPAIHAALSRGELAIDQAIAANRAPAWADEQVAEFATVQTVAQLRRTITKQFFDDGKPAPEPDPVVDEPAKLSTWVDGDGRWRITGSADIATGAVIDAALAEAKESLFEQGDESPSWFDAFTEMANRSLDAVTSPARRDRYRTYIHLDAEASASTTAGWRIPMAIRDHLTCDGVVQPVWERDGKPVNVGRSQRIVPDRTRRLVERRDGACCRAPGCNRKAYIEIHHILHWIRGGMTDTHNLICLCAKHHRLHHQGKLGISGNADDPDGVVFTDENGTPIESSGRPKVPKGPPPEPASKYEHAEGGRMDYAWFNGWVHPDVLKSRRSRPDIT